MKGRHGTYPVVALEIPEGLARRGTKISRAETMQLHGGADSNEKTRDRRGFVHRERGQRRFFRSRCASWAAEVPGYWEMTCWRMPLALSLLPRRRSTSASLYSESGTFWLLG